MGTQALLILVVVGVALAALVFGVVVAVVWMFERELAGMEAEESERNRDEYGSTSYLATDEKVIALGPAEWRYLAGPLGCLMCGERTPHKHIAQDDGVFGPPVELHA